MAILLLIPLAGCKPSGQSAALTPKAVAKNYLRAMLAGNDAGILEWSAGDEPSAIVLIAQAHQLAAQERYVAAATAKFGDPAPALVGKRAADHPAIRLTTIDNEKETLVDEQSAYLGEGPTKLYLTKTAMGWSVDRSRLVPPGLTDPTPYVATLRSMQEAYDHAATEVTAGRLATPAEAKAAVMGGVAQRLGSTKPTSMPATKRT